MTVRKRKRQPASPLTGRLAHVSCERNGFVIAIADVEAPKAFDVLIAMIEALRAHGPAYPELRERETFDAVGGYAPVDVREEDGEMWTETPVAKAPAPVVTRKRVGF